MGCTIDTVKLATQRNCRLIRREVHAGQGKKIVEMLGEKHAMPRRHCGSESYGVCYLCLPRSASACVSEWISKVLNRLPGHSLQKAAVLVHFPMSRVSGRVSQVSVRACVAAYGHQGMARELL